MLNIEHRALAVMQVITLVSDQDMAINMSNIKSDQNKVTVKFALFFVSIINPGIVAPYFYCPKFVLIRIKGVLN